MQGFIDNYKVRNEENDSKVKSKDKSKLTFFIFHDINLILALIKGNPLVQISLVVSDSDAIDQYITSLQIILIYPISNEVQD